MALSQIQCLDDNHVNPRTHESKPEFLYCEEQRLALEILLRDGREAFFKQLEERGVRGFLSDLELTALSGAVEPYDPGAQLYREDPEDEHNPLSLHYWPDMSDMSIPELDMGWPNSEAYRGVTRTTVHTQPPLEGQVHIKEVIRKMIAQAQKVIAVVMDIFTDADIFRDLLDASYKRKVSVYILLERTYIPHFLSMCQRASMHIGHLKNLRVRCSGGTDFLTHSCTKIRGHMGHRFMFIDGDKAVSGSYSFTWMSSRLDRNLITVVTGQAVDTFDRLFCFLYTSSKLVDLRNVATGPEPEPDRIPQPASVALPSAAVARKLYNPKYALVAMGNTSLSPSSSAGNNSPKESQKDTKNEMATKKGRRRQSKDTGQEAPPLHPGLVDLEKAYLFDYLPTWPEPDPPSDVIGFINIRDNNKPVQVHLQRSEMFEVSQAIRFSSPISKQKETLPADVAKPRNLTPAKHEENPPQQKQSSEPSSKDLTVTKSDKENIKSTKKEPPANKTYTSTANFSPRVSRQSAVMATTQTVSPSSLKTESKMHTPTSVNSKSALQNRNSLEWNQSSKPLATSDSNSQIKIQNFSENTSSTGNIPNNVNSTSVSSNYQVSLAIAVPSTLTSTSPIQPSNAISTSISKPTTNSPIATSPVTSSPVPKPRTVQLVIKDSGSNDQKIPEVSIVKKVDSKAKVTAVDNVSLVVTALPQKASETVPELANKSVSKLIPQKSTEDTAAKDFSQQKESKKSHEEQASDKGELQPVAGNKIMAHTKAQVSQTSTEANLNIHKEVSKNTQPTHLQKGIIIRRSDILDDKPTEIPIKHIVNIHNSTKLERTYQDRAGVPGVSHSSSDENLDWPNTPFDRSPILKPQQNLEPLNSSTDSSPFSKPKQNLDPLSSPIDSFPFSKPKMSVNLLNSLIDSSAIVKQEQKLDLLDSPFDRSLSLNLKQNFDPLHSPSESSQILKCKQNLESLNSSIDSSLISKQKQNLDSLNPSFERSPIVQTIQNLDSPNSPTERSPILKPKHNLDPLNSLIDSSPILKSKPNVELLNLPTERSPIVKTKNLDSLNSPTDRSPILKRKLNLDSLNSATDNSLIIKYTLDPLDTSIDSSQIVKPKQNLDPLNSMIDSSLILKSRQNVESRKSPIEGSSIVKTRQNLESLNSSIDSSLILNPKHNLDPLNSLNDSSPIVKPNQNLDLVNSPMDRSPILKPKQHLQSINYLIDKSPILKPKRSEIKATVPVDTQQTDILYANESMPQSAKLNSHNPLQSPREVPEKPMHLHLNSAQLTDLTIPEKDSRTLLTQRRSPILDGFSSRVPTPDSRRSRTPDFRTPSSDFSDSYGSTTSDEYYECSESLFPESKDQVPFYSLNAKEDNEIHIANSCGSYKEQAGRLSIENTLSSSETLNLSTKGSLSSIVEKLDDEEKLSNDMQKEPERADWNLESLPAQDNYQSLSKSSKVVSQSAVAEQSVSPWLKNEATEAKRTPARELKPKRVYSRAERPDRMAAGGGKSALSAGGVERRETVPTANKERDPGVFARLRQSANPSHPSHPPRSRSASRSTLLSTFVDRTERKLTDGNLPISDAINPSPSRQVPPRPPMPKAWQLPASPAKPNADQTQNFSPVPKPQPSFLYSQSQNMQQTPVASRPQRKQAAESAAGPGVEEEKTAFGITFSKLYNIRGLKDKMSKTPAQSRRSSRR